MSDFAVDSETLDAIIDVASSAAVASGLAATGVVVPVAAMTKLLGRLAVGDVEVDNPELKAALDEMNSRGARPTVSE